MNHRLGLLPAVRPHGLEELKIYAKGKLALPPTRVPVPNVAAWGMDGNDEYGCCAIAGGAHDVAAWDAILAALKAVNVTLDPVPTEDEVIAQYKALTGCQTPGDAHDTGLVLAHVLQAWQTVGLFGGTKIRAYAPVDHTNILDLHTAIASYGVAYVGVALPQSAEEQFQAGEPWALVGDAPVGGHCIVLVGYDEKWLYAVSWGSVVQISWAWWAYYGTEAWAIIPEEYVQAGPSVDLDQLVADLNALMEPTVPWWKRLIDEAA